MLHIRLLRGCLVCLVRLPGSAPVGGLRVAVIASPRLRLKRELANRFQ